MSQSPGVKEFIRESVEVVDELAHVVRESIGRKSLQGSKEEMGVSEFA